MRKSGSDRRRPTPACISAVLSISCFWLPTGTSLANAAEIKVLSGSAIEATMAELIPQFERASGHTVVFDFNGTIGGMADRIRRGEAADVIIVSRPQVASLEEQGKVVPGSRADIAKVGIGLFVRKGALRPDISSADSFVQAMLRARSVGWNDPAAGAPVSVYMIALFERLGIAKSMTPKIIAFKQRSERFAAVARGDVELGFNQLSEIVVAPGVDLVGPLPDPLQNYTVFSAAIVAGCREPEAGRDFIRFVSSPAAAQAWKARAFQPP